MTWKGLQAGLSATAVPFLSHTTPMPFKAPHTSDITTGRLEGYFIFTQPVAKFARGKKPPGLQLFLLTCCEIFRQFV